MSRLDAETRSYLRREIDRIRRIEIEGRDPRQTWNEATVVDALRAFETAEGRKPVRRDFDDAASGLPSARTIARIFGTVDRAREAAFPAWSRVEIEQTTLFEIA